MNRKPEFDRRRILQFGAAAGAVVGTGALVSCGPAADATGSSARAASLLRIAAADATNSSGLDPRTTSIGASLIALRHVYDSLMVLKDGRYAYGLAESAEPNRDATRWTIRLRKNVTFHDGRPVRAADVAYSIKTLATPPSNRASVYADVDIAAIKVLGEHTVEIPLKRPRGDFKESSLVVFSVVFPDGTKDFAKAIGSGPYKLGTSDARTVRLVANKDYWGTKPAVQTLEITRIADPTARLNAVKSGQVDYAVGIGAASARAERANQALSIVRSGVANANGLSFAMNQRLAPFDDPQVRRAVRLCVDREALVAKSLLGLGTPADDVIGKGLPGYAAGLAPRKRDVAQARRLFKAAGVSELTLRTSEIVPGMLSASRLFAQQLAEAGVKLTLDEVPADSYYADLKSLATHPFQAFYYINRPASVHLATVTHQKAPFNVTGTGKDWWRRLAIAQTTIDDNARAKAFAALQQEFYDNGGDVLWGFQEQPDAARKGIEGVYVNQSATMFDRATSS
ncbi:ABC transporter substrate-binding protein [Streptomyces sp. NPDC048442]|uniref:ABC transporter substrate-binding protein n=1 Tax=Streptomyces sp. NPDC048442 TaxID=3154823 RepID=UPI00342293B4